MIERAPEVNDLVCIGKHGKPMKVLEVWPITELVNVMANDGSRFIAMWDELYDRWEGFYQDLQRDESTRQVVSSE